MLFSSSTIEAVTTNLTFSSEAIATFRLSKVTTSEAICEPDFSAIRVSLVHSFFHSLTTETRSELKSVSPSLAWFHASHWLSQVNASSVTLRSAADQASISQSKSTTSEAHLTTSVFERGRAVRVAVEATEVMSLNVIEEGVMSSR
jgi:hypothetical protein